MALFDDIAEGVKTVFLAGVGAVAVGAEKSQDLIEDLVRKGEMTVEQGKSLNEELTRKVRETTANASDEMLRTKFRNMTAEERADWIDRARKISDDLEAEDAEYEVEDIPVSVPDEPEDVDEAAADEA